MMKSGSGGSLFSSAIPARWVKPVARWESGLHSAARDDRYSYPTPSRRVLKARIASASRAFGFRVIVLRFVRAPQGAPLLIVQPDSSPSSFAPKVGRLEVLLDPHHQAAKDWHTTAYEGFFIGRRTATANRSSMATTSFEHVVEASGHARRTSTPSRTDDRLGLAESRRRWRD